MLEDDIPFVVVKDCEIVLACEEYGVQIVLDAIDDFGEELAGCIIGDKMIGKASALLYVYSNVAGVYAHNATKTAIAVLIMSGVPAETDKLIDYAQIVKDVNLARFEKLVQGIDTPDEAYDVLRMNVNF